MCNATWLGMGAPPPAMTPTRRAQTFSLACYHLVPHRGRCCALYLDNCHPPLTLLRASETAIFLVRRVFELLMFNLHPVRFREIESAIGGIKSTEEKLSLLFVTSNTQGNTITIINLNTSEDKNIILTIRSRWKRFAKNVRSDGHRYRCNSLLR